jgi:hypothetical protein
MKPSSNNHLLIFYFFIAVCDCNQNQHIQVQEREWAGSLRALVINGNSDSTESPRWQGMKAVCSQQLSLNCSRVPAVFVGEEGSNGFGRCNMSTVSADSRKVLGSKLAHRAALELVKSGGTGAKARRASALLLIVYWFVVIDFGSPVIIFEDDVVAPLLPADQTRKLMWSFLSNSFQSFIGPQQNLMTERESVLLTPDFDNIAIIEREADIALLGYCGDFMCMHAYAVGSPHIFLLFCFFYFYAPIASMFSGDSRVCWCHPWCD